MSDLDKIDYIQKVHSDNVAAAAVIARYNLTVGDANYWHIQAVNNPDCANTQEAYANYSTRFRMCQQMLDDVWMALQEID